MKAYLKVLFLAVAVLGTAVGLLIVHSKSAECGWCPSYKCYGPCGGSCQCVTFGSEIGGHCVSVERITPEMTVLK